VRAADASARWGCDHVAPSVCPWCANPDGEVYRDTSDYAPVYGFQAPVVEPSSTLAEWIEKTLSPGFWERTGGVS
jgi:hypothetical protein